VPKKDDPPKAAPYDIGTKQPPFETKELRKALRAFLNTPHTDPKHPEIERLGGYKYGVYAFYDYDGEPIYVGQTSEMVSARIGRHITNQRTDAVAMNVLDPYEVFEVEIWPLPELEGTDDFEEAYEYLDRLEYTVYEHLRSKSMFKAVLNEKAPPPKSRVPIPKSHRQRVVTDAVREMRGHPDTRIARRAATLARLAQVVSERNVQPGLRRTLLTQAKRLQHLAQERYRFFEQAAEKADKKPSGDKSNGEG
jgi:hypothetical protein